MLAIREELGLPVKFIGVGESIDDLQPFDAEDFAEALFAREETEEGPGGRPPDCLPAGSSTNTARNWKKTKRASGGSEMQTKETGRQFCAGHP